jgi:hypothetical protein
MRETRIFGSVLSFVLLYLCSNVQALGNDDLPFTPVPLKPECRHVEILDPDEPSDTDKVPPDFRYFDGVKTDSNLYKVQRYQRKVIHLALNTLPKVVCDAVRMVAVYRQIKPDENGKIHGKILASTADAWVFEDYPHLINIQLAAFREGHFDPDDPARNEGPIYNSSWPIAISRIIHEAYHCAVNLLDENEKRLIDALGPDPSDHWPANVNKEAKRIMSKTRLDGDGFTESWAELHEDTIDDIEGPDYDKTIIMNRKVRPADGFMTYYARKDVEEDIAETASSVVGRSMIFNAEYLDPKHNMAPPADVKTWIQPCVIAKKANVGGILEKQAVLFLKLDFLVDVEFISENDRKNCIGSSTKGVNKLDGKKTGFHFYNYENGQYLKSYTEDFSITRTSEGYLRIKAKGSISKGGKKLESFLEMQFRTEARKLPRGYYKMTWTGNQQNPGPKFAICNYLFPLKVPPDTDFAYSQQVPGDQSQSYCAIEARVLVTNSTEDHIELSMVLFKVARTGPIKKTPGVFNPPVRVIIRWKRDWGEEPPLVSKAFHHFSFQNSLLSNKVVYEVN